MQDVASPTRRPVLTRCSLNSRSRRSPDYCWHSWAEQTDSMERLLGFTFEWVLPGHGQRVQLPADEMPRQLAELVDRMRAGTG